MTYPFLACLLLAGIHVYLGIHVIARKVIFVDLALAQIAALGAVYGVLLGYNIQEDVWAIKGFSMAFAFVGAAVFSLTRMRQERVPHEAIIGITYAVALATTILASAKLPHGSEQVQDFLAGSILWVTKETIFFTAALYALIGLFHYVFREKFLLISFDPNVAEQKQINLRAWDFLFYMSFGLVVTSSVSIAGVLLVFSFLVIPAAIAVLFAQRIRTRLAIGWSVGTLVSFVGVVVSYVEDLPSGPTIVVCFALSLILASIIYFIANSTNRLSRLARVFLGLLAFAALVAISIFFRKDEHRDLLDMLQSPIKNERLLALQFLQQDAGIWQQSASQVYQLLSDPEAEVRSKIVDLIGYYKAEKYLPETHSLLSDQDDLVREAVLRCLRNLHNKESVPFLLAAVKDEKDEFLRVEIAETVLELGNPEGIPILLKIMDHSQIAQVRKDAWEHLNAHLPMKFTFNAAELAANNDEQITVISNWWETNQDNLKWNPASGIFEVEK